MRTYLNKGLDLIHDGVVKDTRTGRVTSLIGQSMVFDLTEGFPLLTTKKINMKHIVFEVAWYLQGTTSINYLTERGINIWNNWADKDNSIGKTYGYQWKHFNDVYDQVAEVKRLLKEDKYSRRIMINGWNPIQLNDMALPPCIVNLHFIVEDNRLNLVVYQRSADFCLGVPYDIAEMALITHLFADEAGLNVGKLTMFYGDLHIYHDHINTFLSDQYLNIVYELPQLNLDAVKETIRTGLAQPDLVLNYRHGPAVKYPIAV